MEPIGERSPNQVARSTADLLGYKVVLGLDVVVSRHVAASAGVRVLKAGLQLPSVFTNLVYTAWTC